MFQNSYTPSTHTPGLPTVPFRDLWEKGVEDVTTQEEVLDQFNTYLDQKVSCFCTVVARKYGKDGSLLDVQINVKNLEVHATE